MKEKMHKRTLKEAEELIKRLQGKLWKQQDLLQEMRMALYYAKKYMKEVSCEINGLWFHHQDGSDLLVSKSELFNVLNNKILNHINFGMTKIDKPLSKLKDFIGW